MRKIENIKQLKEERIRLLQNKMNLEIVIEQDFRELKHDFSPTRLIPAGVSNLVINKNHGLLNDSIGMLIGMIARKVLLRKAGFFTKLIVPIIAGNAASNLVEKKKEKITEWITGLFNKTPENKKSSEYLYEEVVDFYD